MKNKISINAVALLTEQMKTDNADKTLQWFKRNRNDFNADDLANIVEEFLRGIQEDGVIQLLEDVGCELDETYDDLYQLL